MAVFQTWGLVLGASKNLGKIKKWRFFKLGNWDWGLVRISGKLRRGGLQTWVFVLGASKNLGKIKKWRSSKFGIGIGG